MKFADFNVALFDLRLWKVSRKDEIQFYRNYQPTPDDLALMHFHYPLTKQFTSRSNWAFNMVKEYNDLKLSMLLPAGSYTDYIQMSSVDISNESPFKLIPDITNLISYHQENPQTSSYLTLLEGGTLEVVLPKKNPYNARYGWTIELWFKSSHVVQQFSLVSHSTAGTLVSLEPKNVVFYYEGDSNPAAFTFFVGTLCEKEWCLFFGTQDSFNSRVRGKVNEFSS